MSVSRYSRWDGTQNPFGARDQVAAAIGSPANRVRVITPFVGGGFGGKTGNLQAVEATLDEATLRACDDVWSKLRGVHFRYNR